MSQALSIVRKWACHDYDVKYTRYMLYDWRQMNPLEICLDYI